MFSTEYCDRVLLRRFSNALFPKNLLLVAMQVCHSVSVFHQVQDPLGYLVSPVPVTAVFHMDHRRGDTLGCWDPASSCDYFGDPFRNCRCGPGLADLLLEVLEIMSCTICQSREILEIPIVRKSKHKLKLSQERTVTRDSAERVSSPSSALFAYPRTTSSAQDLQQKGFVKFVYGAMKRRDEASGNMRRT